MNYWPLLLIVPILTGFTGQLLKFVIKWITKRNKDVVSFFGYGGAPSTHTALVASVATVTGLQGGIDSAAFAVSVVLGFLVMRDAVGLRNYVNKNLHDIQRLVKYQTPERQKEFTQLHVTVGHTRGEVALGVVVGVGFAWLYYTLLGGKVL
jgi:acid phosphatase family membrane protein YuiD